MKDRDIAIDTLRGLACIFLVAFHVIGTDATQGLKVEGGVYRLANDALELIRMPLFTFLSGYVYAVRPFEGRLGHYAWGKTRRLLFPMLTIGTLFAVCQSLVPGVNNGAVRWETLHLMPVAHYWFVEALFLIFIAMALMEMAGWLATPLRFSVTMLAALALYASPVDLRWLSVNGAIYLLPYFLLGVAIRRFDLPRVAEPGMVLLAVVSACMTVHAVDVYDFGERRDLMRFIPAALFCLAAYLLKPHVRLLALIGGYSYSIYLLHVFFTAASRVVLKVLDVHNVHLLFIVGLTAGIAGSIAAERLLDRWSLTRVYLLGKSPRRKKAHAPPIAPPAAATGA